MLYITGRLFHTSFSCCYYRNSCRFHETNRPPPPHPKQYFHTILISMFRGDYFLLQRCFHFAVTTNQSVVLCATWKIWFNFAEVGGNIIALLPDVIGQAVAWPQAVVCVKVFRHPSSVLWNEKVDAGKDGFGYGGYRERDIRSRMVGNLS